jgi:hypothetical protein
MYFVILDRTILKRCDSLDEAFTVADKAAISGQGSPVIAVTEFVVEAHVVASRKPMRGGENG